MKLGRKIKVRTHFKGTRRIFCMGSLLLSSAQQNPIEDVFYLRVGTYVHLQNPMTGVLQKIENPFPRILLYVRTPLT